MMKLFALLISVTSITCSAIPAQGQILKGLGKKAKRAAERGIEHGVQRAIEHKVRKKTEEKTGKVVDGILNPGKRSDTTAAGKRAGKTASDDPELSVGDFEAGIENILQTGQAGNNALSEKYCPLLTPAEIEEALSLPKHSVIAMSNNACGYEVRLTDGTRSPIYITLQSVPVENVKDEIAAFKNDPSGKLAIKESNSGNNYLCTHKPNYWLLIYTPDQEIMVHLDFSTLRYANMNKDAKVPSFEVAWENAQKVANYLLQKKKITSYASK